MLFCCFFLMLSFRRTDSAVCVLFGAGALFWFGVELRIYYILALRLLVVFFLPSLTIFFAHFVILFFLLFCCRCFWPCYFWRFCPVLSFALCFFLRVVLIRSCLRYAIVCCVGFAFFLSFFVVVAHFVMLTFFAFLTVALLLVVRMVAVVLSGSFSCARVPGFLLAPGLHLPHPHHHHPPP